MSTPTTPVTMTLAEWVASTSLADIVPAARHQVRRAVIDYLAATLVGSAAQSARIVAEYLAGYDSDTTSTVLGTGLRLSPPNAAAANGTAAHALDLDDGYTPGGFHPGGPVVSATLAAAERLGSSAHEIVRAIALGYEVACRLAGATHPRQRMRGFHNTAIVGVFGAATAVGALLGLEPVALANAYGLAGSHAGGINAYLDEGSDVKRYHAGKAARDGLISAELAARGLTAPTTVLETRRGYLYAFAGGEYDLEHLTGRLGHEWRMTRTYFKPYPCCRHVHGAIDAALNIRRNEGLVGESIESVRVATFSIAAEHDGKEIAHTLDAQMSLPYAVSAALIYGEVGMDQFEDQARSDPGVRRIMAATEVVADEGYTSEYPNKRAARVSITAAGREYHDVVEQPYGEPDNPISDEDLRSKFTRLVRPMFGQDRAARILQAGWSLEDPQQLVMELAAPAESAGEERLD